MIASKEHVAAATLVGAKGGSGDRVTAISIWPQARGGGEFGARRSRLSRGQASVGITTRNSLAS